MPDPQFAWAIAVVASFLAGLFLFLWLRGVFQRRRLVREALAKSRATVRGQVSEQLAPHLDGFEYEASDARFLGAPIDYVVFDGYSTDDDDVTVVLVEVKTGKAKLSRGEKRVRDAVENGRVRFEVVRFD